MARKIDDHSFFAGKGDKNNVCPTGCHYQNYDSAKGAGAVDNYPDTSKELKAQQEGSVSKINSQKPNPMKRN